MATTGALASRSLPTHAPTAQSDRQIAGPEKGKNSIFTPKNGPDCAQPLSSAEIWGYQAKASRENVRFEVRCVRSKQA